MGQPKVVLYTTPWCGFCASARRLLTEKKVAFEEIDIEGRPEARAEMIARSGRRTVPQIFIGEQHYGGCDDLYALDAAGGLDPLLSGAQDGSREAT
jgi:glutaredoxin 3